MQHDHYSTQFSERKFPITVVCDGVYFQQNIGSIFRVCEAFGVEKIIFSGEHFVFSERKINKTSRATHKHLPYEIISNQNDLLHYLQTCNASIIALEITSKSTPISQFDFNSVSTPLVILIGSEINGISDAILKVSPHHLHIEMFGKNSSMNVVQSLGIALYEFTK